MRHLLVGLIMLLFATPVAAQPISDSLNRAYVGLWAADLSSTVYFLTAGVGEANPLGKPFEQHPAAFVFASAIGEGTALWAAQRWIAPTHPTLVRRTMKTILVARIALVAWNIYSGAKTRANVNPS